MEGSTGGGPPVSHNQRVPTSVTPGAPLINRGYSLIDGNTSSRFCPYLGVSIALGYEKLLRSFTLIIRTTGFGYTNDPGKNNGTVGTNSNTCRAITPLFPG